MPRLLILSGQYPSDRTSGQLLRIHALCRELTEAYECYFVSMSNPATLDKRGEDLRFADEVYLPERTEEFRSWKRHFRLSNSRMLQQSSPSFYRTTVSKISKLADQWGAQVLVNFSAGLAEVGTAIDLPKVLDYPDSTTLTMERILASRGHNMTVKERILMRIQVQRQMARERDVLNNYNVTTTIAEPDGNRFREVSGVGQDRVVVIPNGVAAELVRQESLSAKRARSLVFWGNLDFPPNWTAITYFFEEIYVPFLAEKGIEFHIVGKGKADQLKDIANHPLVRMAGFQEDLASYVADKGVMINPMIEGSGLKNKVLEAFAMRIPVVSTSLGVEAISGKNGEHFSIADDPEDFSRLVLRLLDDEIYARQITDAASRLVLESYTWSVVGRMFSSVVHKLL